MSTLSSHQLNPGAETRTANAFRLAAILAVVFLGTTGLYLYLFQQTRNWQLGVLGGITALVTLLNFTALFLSRQSRTNAAATLMISGMFLLFPFATTLISGIGLVLGAGGFLGIFLIAALTLIQPHFNRALLAGLILGIGIILLDAFPVLPRLDIPLLRVYIPVVAVAGLVIFIYYFAREFSGYAFRAKLIVLFLIIASVAIGTVSTINNIIIRSELNQQVGTGVIQRARGSAAEVVQNLDFEVRLLETLAQSLTGAVSAENRRYTGSLTEILTDIALLDKQWVESTGITSQVDLILNNPTASNLRRFQNLSPDNAELFVTDVYGANIAATNRTSDYYQGDEDWWRAAFNNGEGNIYIGQPEFDESSQTYAINIAVPVYDRNTVVGVLRTTLNAENFINLLQGEQFGTTGKVDLRLDETNLLNGTPLQPAEITALESAANTYSQFTYQGIQSLVSQIPLVEATDLNDPVQLAIAGLGWNIIVHQDVNEALSTANNQTRTTTLISLAMLFVTALLGYLASQWILAPIVNLGSTVRAIAAGDLSQRSGIETNDEIGALAQTFNSMTSQLQDTLNSLERRVKERTADVELARLISERRAQDLQSISELSRTISTEQRLDILLPLITRLVSERFDFYHVGIFFVDDTKQFAVLQAANSEGGRKMLARGHRLEVGTGLVGTVSQTGKPRIALDVGSDAAFFDNPDLPDTRSEMALPLNFSGETIGVLDVQSIKPGIFTEADANTLGILADQIAIAIENARLFGQTRQAREEAEALFNQFLKTEWNTFLKQGSHIGYRQSLIGGKVLDKPQQTDEIQQALEKGTVVVVDGRENGKNLPVMAIPVRLRGQTIGVLNIRAPKHRRWNPDEISLAQAVSDRLALALDNARLLQESQRRAAKEARIGEMSAKIGASINMRNVLQVAVEELGRALPGSEVIIQFEGQQEN